MCCEVFSSVLRLMRFHCRLPVICLPILLFLSLSAGAQSGIELYAGEVPVASKSDQDRNTALGQALRQVIGKLTGLASPRSPVLDKAGANAENYLQQFQYRGQEIDGSLTLWARFNAKAMDAMVVQSGLPEWSRQRPSVLTWIALRNSQDVDLFNLEDPGGLAQAIRKSAWQRGLPLEFPLLDLEDRSTLTVHGVWALDTSMIFNASRRYDARRIFVARIERGEGDLWTARWTLLTESDVLNWSSQGTSMEAVVAFGINTAADRIAQREVLKPVQLGDVQLKLKVSGIRNLNDYARSLKYLQSFEQVTNLAPSGMRGDELSLHLRVRGGAEALGQLISFGDVLKVAAAVNPDDPVLYFSLVP